VHHAVTATPTLIVPSTRRVTLGDRAFPVAAARAWNTLPASVRAASSLALFRRDLKSHMAVKIDNVICGLQLFYFKFCTVPLQQFSVTASL